MSKSEKKRIMMIAPSLQMGGLERSMSTLANYFASIGHQVIFLTIFPFEPFFILDEKILHITHSYLYGRKNNLLDMLLFYPRIFSPIGGFIRKQAIIHCPDVIVCFGDSAPQLSMVAMLGLKIPFYLSNRSSPGIKYPMHIRIARKIGYFLSKPTGVIAQTSAAAERKKKIIGHDANIRIIPNIVLPLERQNLKKQNWIVTVGRLHYEKGIDRLLDVFKKINQPEWKLIIAGTGKHEQELKKYAVELGISGQVVFPGKVEDITNLLSQSRIFVLPSYGEGFPNALCEAMSVGLPCLSFDIIAGPGDIIENNINGFLIPDGDIETMAEKINYLIGHPEEQIRLGNEAAKIKDKFSLESVGNRYLDFILEKTK